MWAGGWGFWWIFPVLMFGFMVVLGALFMFRGPWSHRQHRDASTSALALLNERFAKGDISKEEFEEKRAILVRYT
jgi:putative membrane protein